MSFNYVNKYNCDEPLKELALNLWNTFKCVIRFIKSRSSGTVWDFPTPENGQVSDVIWFFFHQMFCCGTSVWSRMRRGNCTDTREWRRETGWNLGDVCTFLWHMCHPGVNLPRKNVSKDCEGYPDTLAAD